LPWAAFSDSSKAVSEDTRRITDGKEWSPER